VSELLSLWNGDYCLASLRAKFVWETLPTFESEEQIDKLSQRVRMTRDGLDCGLNSLIDLNNERMLTHPRAKSYRGF
jgi:hypothetical protein